MKRQDLIKYHEQSIPELKNQVAKLTDQLTETTMKRAMGQEKNLRQGKFIRQDIARLQSIIREKELAAVALESANKGK
jgi:ribosomal protein L29